MSLKILALGLLLWGAAHAGPSDEENCPLTSQTIYPWVTRIWHVKQKDTFGHGAILSYLAILTTCTNFGEEQYDPKRHPDDYEIIGNKVIELNPTEQVCYQSRPVRTYIRHPKCLPPDEYLYDFGIFILREPFNATGAYSYPTMPMLNDLDRMMLDYAFILDTRDASCEFPLLYFRDRKDMTFRTTWQVNSLDFTNCLDQFCEYNPSNVNMTIACKNRYGDRTNFTELCMKPKTSLIDGQVEYNRTGVNWYAGGTLVCNGSGYGFSSLVKWRNTFNTLREDFFFVQTFLRVYSWITENRVRYGANWIRLLFLEREKLKTQVYTLPSRKPRTEPTLFPEDKRKAYKRILNLVNPQPFNKDGKERSRLLEDGESSVTALEPLIIALGFISLAVLRFL